MSAKQWLGLFPAKADEYRHSFRKALDLYEGESNRDRLNFARCILGLDLKLLLDSETLQHACREERKCGAGVDQHVCLFSPRTIQRKDTNAYVKSSHFF